MTSISGKILANSYLNLIGMGATIIALQVGGRHGMHARAGGQADRGVQPQARCRSALLAAPPCVHSCISRLKLSSPTGPGALPPTTPHPARPPSALWWLRRCRPRPPARSTARSVPARRPWPSMCSACR